MLGFNPVAASPVADVGYSVTAAVTSQSLAGNLGTVAFATNNNVAVSGLSATFTLNQESIQADSAKIIVANLPALLTYLGQDTIIADSNFTPDSLSLTADLNSPSYISYNYIPVTGQALNATLTSVSIQNGHTIDVTGLGLTTTIHSLRSWRKIDTSQTPNWTKIQT